MSLINDALRRATTENKRDAKELPAMEPTFRPVRTGGPGFSIFVVCFLVAALLTLGLWIYWRRGLVATTAKPAPAAQPANTNNNPIARATRTLGAVDALNKEGENVVDNMQSPALATNVGENGSRGRSPSQSENASGGLKLQGIFYSANNPTVIINGKSMKVGDEANGVKVLEIKKQSVRVQTGSEVRELTMK